MVNPFPLMSKNTIGINIIGTLLHGTSSRLPLLANLLLKYISIHASYHIDPLLTL